MTGVRGDLDDTELADMSPSYLASGLRAMSAYPAIRHWAGHILDDAPWSALVTAS
jgi:hypothetical protein